MIKKIITLIIIFIFCTFSLCGCENNDNNNKTTTDINKTGLTVELPTIKEPVEQEIANFSTTIKSKGAGRLNNIRITCSKINGQIVDSMQEFSFEQIVGKSTPEEGYQKADIFVNKQIVQAYGGGNCQVSSTLYNAVLQVPELNITERHPHGRKVDYVPEGKDAAVSYGTLDLKFINNLDTKIKIYASSDDNTVNIRIVKIVE